MTKIQHKNHFSSMKPFFRTSRRKCKEKQAKQFFGKKLRICLKICKVMRSIRNLHPNLGEGLPRDSVVGIGCTDVRGLPKSAERGRTRASLKLKKVVLTEDA